MMDTNVPTILVVFGATGDLMQKKIAPALFHLFEKQRLPELFQVVGFAFQDFSSEDFQDHISKILSSHRDIKQGKGKISPFLNLFSFQGGRFENKDDYQNLAKVLGQIDGQWKVCSNKLFYIAASPKFYEIIFKQLASSGLTKPCSQEEGWTRVIVEKPFGDDLETAKKLDKILAGLFKEEQIYRIDHYLAKEMLQNILAFRFSNNLFEQNWSNQLIEKIEIKLLESIGVEDRGSFYDSIGALRDVGQNHLLQMLALITMDQPEDFEAGTVRLKRAQVLKTLRIPSQEDIRRFSYRAQYIGYRQIKGVKPNSNTETYFKIRAFLDSPRWQGVPIILESGKRTCGQKEDACQRNKEIILTMKRPAPCVLCPSDGPEHYRNKIIFILEPEEKIIIQFWSKKSGLKMEVEERTFEFIYRQQEKKSQYTEEYEKLLLDCICGDQTLFISTEEVTAMWRFIDPIFRAWQKNIVPLKTYQPNTDRALIESEFVGESLAQATELKKEIGIVGLGKMGKNMAARLSEKGWKVLGFDQNPHFEKLVSGLTVPRIVWLMVPAGKPVEEVIFGKNGLVNFLSKGDIIIDGGNSFYQDSLKRAALLAKKQIEFIDVGVSGGPAGARSGACLMIGGRKGIYEYLLPLFSDLAVNQGIQFFEGQGAGHFVKMIHNGIEYGMMQAIAEGFTILKKSKYKLDLTKIADVYNQGSVIESRLMGWLKNALELHREDLKNVPGKVAHTGEGEWTVKTARELGVKTKIIEGALKFRIQSEKNPNYTGKILSALREQFGGHAIK